MVLSPYMWVPDLEGPTGLFGGHNAAWDRTNPLSLPGVDLLGRYWRVSDKLSDKDELSIAKSSRSYANSGSL